jgi:PhnB protein
MKVSVEDFRRQYADLSDEALLDVDRQDLVELARACYDEELARRQLKAAAPVAAPGHAAAPAPEPHSEVEEFGVAETFESQEEARLARELLRGAGIRAHLGTGGLALLVPASTMEEARQVLAEQISEEALAEAATAGASYVRHGVGAVRPYLYGNLDLIEFVQQVFGAVELERFAFGPRSFHVEAAIGDSVVVLEISDPPPASAAPCSIYVYVPDVDAAYGRALEAGATEIAPPEDKLYNERAAGVKDSFGNTWWMATYQAP